MQFKFADATNLMKIFVVPEAEKNLTDSRVVLIEKSYAPNRDSVRFVKNL